MKLTTYVSERSSHVSQLVIGCTICPRQTAVDVAVLVIVAASVVVAVAVAVAVAVVCAPIYKVEEDVVYGNVVEQFCCTE
jgi:hypothetical protein